MSISAIMQITITWLFLLVIVRANDQDIWGSKWRILALEGGGDKGSYEAGAFKAFVELLDSKEVQYDVVTGVSVGAINAAAIALHKKGDEQKCSNWLTQMWMDINADDIYASWPLGIAEGLTTKEGIYNNAVEGDFLTKAFSTFKDKKMFRKWVINTVDFDSGEVVNFDESSEWNSIPKRIVSSTSMPFAFTHSHIENSTYVDGGSVWNLEIGKGIDRCLETHVHQDIIVDVIMCSGLQITYQNESHDYNTMHNYDRYRQFKSYYRYMSDLDEITRGFPEINFRYIVVPKQRLPSGYIPLGFKHDSIEQMIQAGYEDATAVIKQYPRGNFGIVGEFMDRLYNVYNPETTAYYKKMKANQL